MHASYLKRLTIRFISIVFNSKTSYSLDFRLKVNKVTAKKAQISIRCQYLNQNLLNRCILPVGDGREMSTGLLAMGYIDSHSQEISMLVLDLSCKFTKSSG